MAGFDEGCGSGLLTALIKPAPIIGKDKKKELLNVFMDFDLDNKEISFKFAPYNEESEAHYNFFGNNAAAAKQNYAVRDAGSLLNFWFGRPNGVMDNVYNFVAMGELKELLKECSETGLFTNQGIDGTKIHYIDASAKFSVLSDKENKGLYLNGEKYAAEQFLRNCLDIGNTVKLMLVIPCIIKNKKRFIISLHTDYIKAVEDSLQSEKGDVAVCHVCGRQQTDINTKEYSSKLSKSSIGKVFVTTTVNYAPNFNRKHHQKNYSLCKSCYEKIMFGEKKVMRDFKIKIAREDCVILFSGIKKQLELTYIEKIQSGLDLFFNPKDSQEWFQSFQADVEKEQDLPFYEFNLVFYKTDGKSCAVKKTIENISKIRFQQVEQGFRQAREQVGEAVPYFTMGHIYHMIPVTANNKGEQIDIARVLNLYSAILQGQRVEKAVVFDFAIEALTKGLNELRASKLRNYKNLEQLSFLAAKPNCNDIFIYRIIMKYIALFHALQNLHILDKEVFSMMESEIAVDVPEYILKMEEFLDKQGFSKEAKGLFYLGALIHKVGMAQYKQEHQHKPILDKITYTGMNSHEVITLYEEVLEKTRQYKTVLLKFGGLSFCEQVEKQFHQNLGYITQESLLNEKENVFYIMAGYAFNVMNYKKKDETNIVEAENNGEE